MLVDDVMAEVGRRGAHGNVEDVLLSYCCYEEMSENLAAKSARVSLFYFHPLLLLHTERSVCYFTEQ